MFKKIKALTAALTVAATLLTVPVAMADDSRYGDYALPDTLKSRASSLSSQDGLVNIIKLPYTTNTISLNSSDFKVTSYRNGDTPTSSAKPIYYVVTIDVSPSTDTVQKAFSDWAKDLMEKSMGPNDRVTFLAQNTCAKWYKPNSPYNGWLSRNQIPDFIKNWQGIKYIAGNDGNNSKFPGFSEFVRDNLCGDENPMNHDFSDFINGLDLDTSAPSFAGAKVVNINFTDTAGSSDSENNFAPLIYFFGHNLKVDKYYSFVNNDGFGAVRNTCSAVPGNKLTDCIKTSFDNEHMTDYIHEHAPETRPKVPSTYGVPFTVYGSGDVTVGISDRKPDYGDDSPTYVIDTPFKYSKDVHITGGQATGIIDGIPAPKDGYYVYAFENLKDNSGWLPSKGHIDRLVVNDHTVNRTNDVRFKGLTYVTCIVDSDNSLTSTPKPLVTGFLHDDKFVCPIGYKVSRSSDWFDHSEKNVGYHYVHIRPDGTPGYRYDSLGEFLAKGSKDSPSDYSALWDFDNDYQRELKEKLGDYTGPYGLINVPVILKEIPVQTIIKFVDTSGTHLWHGLPLGVNAKTAYAGFNVPADQVVFLC